MAKPKPKPKSGAAVEKKVNKSRAIRDFMTTNPKAGPTEVSDALAKKGVKVSAAFVSTVKSNAKSKSERVPRGVGRPRGSKNGVANGQFTVDQLLQTKQFVEQHGGIEQARGLLDALAKLA